MQKLKMLRSKNDRCFGIANTNKLFDFIRYDCKVDIENKTYISIAETDEWKTSTLPTLNELVDKGIVTEEQCYEEYEINPIGDFHIEDIIKEFADNGFEVSYQAILHNYRAWQRDLKSGYRGRKTHLFTPCGCNPLSFRATTLHHKAKDWQKTYVY